MKSAITSNLENISKFLRMCKLKLNVSKTKFMCIGSPSSINNLPEIEIVMEQQVIERVSEMKYLGIMIDENLNFKEQIKNVVNKVSKKVYFLGRMKRKLDRDTKCMLYKTLIVPHIDYSSSILFLCNSCEIDQLQRIQNVALRHILLKDRYESINNMLSELNVLNERQQVYFNLLKIL